MPDDFLDVLLVELRTRSYLAEDSFEVLATILSDRGVFGLRFNAAPRSRFIVSKVSGLDWTPLAIWTMEPSRTTRSS